MLYNNFIFCIMTCGGISLIAMIINQDWEYILLPIGILIWGFYKFFNDDDEEYRRRHEYDYDVPYRDIKSTRPNVNGNTISWRGNTPRVEDDFDFDLFGLTKSKKEEDYTRYQPKTTTFDKRKYQDPRYKGMVDKCKRNFKITISEEKEKNNDESKSRIPIFHGINCKW